MISIIIPAFNEEKVIQRTLAALEPGISTGKFQVIVVCNGCYDNTAQVVRCFHTAIICVELARASKTDALNAGNQIAQYFPRVYLDADIQMDYFSVLSLTEPLKHEHYRGASPVIKVVLEGASFWVRAYYHAWLTLPYCADGQVWVGAYALSKQGQACVGVYPPIIADDSYACFSLSPEERVAVQQAYSVIISPKSLKWLIPVLIRVRTGSCELFQKYPEFKKRQRRKKLHDVVQWLSSGLSPSNILIYIVMNITIRLLVKWRLLCFKKTTDWARDQSSRE